MSFNLFGDLASDHGLADRAVHTWWPDVPGTVGEVRFAHSPGRLPRYREITETSGVFGPEAIDGVNGTDLIHIWLDHLLGDSALSRKTSKAPLKPGSLAPERAHGLRRSEPRVS